jgi:nicotinamidase/pyrazinamidase
MPEPFPADTALIIVDVQNDFMPNGALAVEGGDQIIPIINALKPNFALTILTQDWHPPEHKSFASNHENAAPFTTTEMPYGTQILWPSHCIQNSVGAAFNKDLNIENNDLVLKKGTNKDIDSYSGFFENDQKTKPHFFNGKTLTDTLKDQDIKNIIFCGLAYDFCVGWHALDAKKEGFEAIIIKDATRAIAMPLDKDEGTSETAMDKQLKEAGVHIINTQDLENQGPQSSIWNLKK